MTAFRTVEQVLQDSIIKSLVDCSPSVELDIIKEKFEEHKKTLQKSQSALEITWSDKTQNEIDNVSMDSEQTSSNTLYLNGMWPAQTKWGRTRGRG